MLFRIGKITRNDLEKVLFESHFPLIQSVFIILLTMIVLILLPRDTYLQFSRPLVGPIYAYLLSCFLVLSNIIIFNQRINISFRSLKERGFKDDYSLKELVIGRTLVIITVNFLLLLSSWPVGLIIIWVGGLPAAGLVWLLVIALLAGCGFGFLAFYINEIFINYSRSVLNILLGFYLIIALFTYDPYPATAYLSFRFNLFVFGFSVLLLVDLIFNLMSFVFADRY